MRQSATASADVRLAFRVIPGTAEHPIGSVLDDDEFDFAADAIRPSVFYFRRALRTCVNRPRLRYIASTVLREHRRLVAWTEEQLSEVESMPRLFLGEADGDLARACTSEEMKTVGLRIIAAHERLRVWLREELDLYAPKWEVDPDEAKAKDFESRRSA